MLGWLGNCIWGNNLRLCDTIQTHNVVMSYSKLACSSVVPTFPAFHTASDDKSLGRYEARFAVSITKLHVVTVA